MENMQIRNVYNKPEITRSGKILEVKNKESFPINPSLYSVVKTVDTDEYYCFTNDGWTNLNIHK